MTSKRIENPQTEMPSAKISEKDLNALFAAVLDTHDGRIIRRSLMDAITDGYQPDSGRMYFDAGARSVVKIIETRVAKGKAGV
jgi:hypothetical protein